METCYKIPDWASKLPIGLHLEILKENKVVQKLLIDEKKSYQSGRTVETNDISIDMNNSCSRVHAAIVYHKHLKRSFLIDLESSQVERSVPSGPRKKYAKEVWPGRAKASTLISTNLLSF
ncbi:unnamed protein product [Leptidea sinapis]|uniref:FHA domain-containing protein n=1 Tax=Leptidea sinapis TaxID=189913 RepID=A0A5E4Q0E2_9NEOP|nr:unnamed protein product [Leptidea sinapis]